MEAQSKYTFITKNDAESTVYAISTDRIEELNYSDCYGDYGQRVGADVAGDSVILLTQKAVDFANTLNEENDYKIGDAVYGDQTWSQYTDIESEFPEGSEDVEYNKAKVMGFTYWDGHNWQTVITETDFYEPNYLVVQDDKLIAQLNEAIEKSEYKEEKPGLRIFKYADWEVTENNWVDSFAAWEITEA